MSKDADISKEFAGQLPKNLISNIIYFLANVAIGIILVPYFVSNLGVAAYGLIPLATSITGYMAILVQSLNSAVSRFLTVDLQRKDYDAANRTFNTSLFALSAAILLMIPAIIIFSWLIPKLFSVPVGQEDDTVLLFLGVAGAFLIRLWSGNFTVQLFAYNRLDLQNLVNLSNILIQTGLIFSLFALFGPNLLFIGVSYLVSAVISSGISIILARQVCPYLQISIRSFDRSRLRDLCGMGWWVVVDQIGTLFLFQIDLIIVNLLFGAIAAGEYAIAQQWSILLSAIAGTLANVLIPTMLACYALKNAGSLISITQSGVKFMVLVMALPAGLICGFSTLLLTLWVGAEYASLAPLLVLLTAPLAINISVLPLFSISVAYNKVKIPGIMTILFGIVNLILAIIIPLITGWGYYGVAIAGVVVLTLRHTLFVPWYTAKILSISMITYIRSLFFGVLALLLIGIAVASIVTVTSSHSLPAMIVIGMVISLVYGIIVLGVAPNSFEKQIFKSYIPQTWKKIVQ